MGYNINQKNELNKALNTIIKSLLKSKFNCFLINIF